nr:MAG TPA: hypothetical protein [Caudoviricetes sp.]
MGGETERQEKGRGRCELRSASMIKHHNLIIKENRRNGKHEDIKNQD